jgi:hypothetical protein
MAFIVSGGVTALPTALTATSTSEPMR